MVGQISFSSSNPTLGQLSKTGDKIGSVSIGQFSNFLFCLSDVFVLFLPIVCRSVVISGEPRFFVSPDTRIWFKWENLFFSSPTFAAVVQCKARFPLNFFCWSSSDQGFSTVFFQTLKNFSSSFSTASKNKTLDGPHESRSEHYYFFDSLMLTLPIFPSLVSA